MVDTVHQTRSRRRRALAFGLAAFVVLLDQVTKLSVLRAIPEGGMRPVTSWFALTHSTNEGAAFGSLSRHPDVLTVVAIAATLLVLYLLIRAALDSRYFGVGLALVLGGAVGNLIDRLRLGHVVDFLKLHRGRLAWPDFNVADIAVTVGAILVALYLYLGAQSSAAAQLEAMYEEDEEAEDLGELDSPPAGEPGPFPTEGKAYAAGDSETDDDAGPAARESVG